jgi:hypothetical protein
MRASRAASFACAMCRASTPRRSFEVLQAWEKVLQDLVAGKVTDTAKVMPLEARGLTDQ